MASPQPGAVLVRVQHGAATTAHRAIRGKRAVGVLRGLQVQEGIEWRPKRPLLSKSLIDLEGEVRLSDAAFLGKDLDYASGGFRTVQSTSRRTLDDLNPFDVRWVDVVQRARLHVRSAAAVIGDWPIPVITLTPSAHSIDVDDGKVALVDAH